MRLSKELFRKTTIIGVGLIGGSLGLALKKRGLARQIAGLSQKQTTLMTAVKMGAIDEGHQDLRKAVHNADLVILATPVGIILNMLSAMGPYLKRNCIVTDVGSTKAAIVSAAQISLPPSVYFVGSHPLAGSEKKGVQSAVENLFDNSLCIMTPTERTHKGACERVKRLWMALGTQVKYLPPDHHDKILGYISHLPHVMAYALIAAIPQEFLPFAAQGLKDTTRVASSSAQMWSDICLTNTDHLINALDEVVKNLSAIRRSISINDAKGLLNHFKEAKAKRDSLV